MEAIDISYDWLKTKVRELGEGRFILVQGYEWTGLGQFRDDAFIFDRDVEWRWSEIWDVRLFGRAGEWHCWKSGDGVWFGRFVDAEKVPEDFRIERNYVLWGRGMHESWAQEANGARVFIPIQAEGDLRARPLRLAAWELVESDEKTGQCFIGDAILRDVWQTKEEVR
jgi:hypothetical protein